MQFKQLSTLLVNTNDTLYHQAVKAVNIHLTLRNWLFGFYIVQYEQNGEDRAAYGKKVLDILAKNINIKGLTAPELSRCRQFYLCYFQILGSLTQEFDLPASISQSVTDQLQLPNISLALSDQLQLPGKKKAAIFGTVSQESIADEMKYYKALFQKVSFSHFSELIKIKDPLKRRYYELLSIKQTLSVRELKRR